jgi:thymidylate synthase
MKIFNYFDFGSFTEMYQAILRTVLSRPDHVIAPRGLPVREMVNVSVVIDPKDCTVDFTATGAPERQPVYDKYREEELAWYLSGDTLASSAPSKFWRKLADEDGRVTSNYGYMLLHDRKYPRQVWTRPVNCDNPCMRPLTAIEKVVDTLVQDPDSRQAVVHYSEPKYCYDGNLDYPCTLVGLFLLRGGKLHYTLTQRSCDLILGYVYDSAFACHFMGMVRDKLAKKGLKVELGDLTMVFGSLHLYEKNLGLAEKIVSPRSDA